MKISVCDEGKRFFFPVPNLLIFSSLALSLLKHAPGTDSINFEKLTPKQMREIRRCIRRMKKIHTEWCLVDIIDGDTYVKIKM